MEYVLLIVILGIVAMGVWVAKHNQQFIDEQNARIREEIKNDTNDRRTF